MNPNLDNMKLTDMKFVILDTETTGPNPKPIYKVKTTVDGTKQYKLDQYGNRLKTPEGKFIPDYELDEKGNMILIKEKDKVIEYASILYDLKTKTFSESVQMFFNPGCLIPPSAMSVHHITDEMVKDKPKFEDELEFIKNKYLKDHVKVAYNSKFDSGIMGLDDYGIWIDAYRLAMKTWHIGQKNEDGFELTSFKQQELRYWLKLPKIEGDAHRADFDIKITSLILDKIIENYLDKGYKNSWKDFKKYYNEKIEFVTMPIGSSNVKGKRLEEFTAKELDYICNPKSPLYETYLDIGVISWVSKRRSQELLKRLSNGNLIVPKATKNSVNNENTNKTSRKMKF